MGNSLVAQWLELCASVAGGMGLIPATWCSQKKKKTNKKSVHVFVHMHYVYTYAHIFGTYMFCEYLWTYMYVHTCVLKTL